MRGGDGAERVTGDETGEPGRLLREGKTMVFLDRPRGPSQWTRELYHLGPGGTKGVSVCHCRCFEKRFAFLDPSTSTGV